MSPNNRPARSTAIAAAPSAGQTAPAPTALTLTEPVAAANPEGPDLTDQLSLERWMVSVTEGEQGSQFFGFRGVLEKLLPPLVDAIRHEAFEAPSHRPGPPPTAARALQEANADPPVVALVGLFRVFDLARLEVAKARIVEEVGAALCDELKVSRLAAAVDRSDGSPPRWPPTLQYQVGLFVTRLVRDCIPLFELKKRRVLVDGEGRIEDYLRIRPELKERLNAAQLESSRPQWWPMIEPPQNWSALAGGGYHALPTALLSARRWVEAEKVQKLIDRSQADLTRVYRAVNHLQQVRWAINVSVLNTADQLFKATAEGNPKSESAIARRSAMKRLKEQAAKLKEQAAIFFPVYLDHRGRIYYRPGPLSPQGGDLSKALLVFAKPRPLGTLAAYRWLLRHGANVLGENGSGRLSAEDQVVLMESITMRARVSAISHDPMSTLGSWIHAADPWRFLAFAFEYGRYLRLTGQDFTSKQYRTDLTWLSPEEQDRKYPVKLNLEFETALPISMDASASGVQHYSLATRDSEGAAVSNLIGGEEPRDLYREVANSTLAAIEHSEDELLQRWHASGLINRSLVLLVMAKQYNLTQRGACRKLQETLEERYAATQDDPESFPFRPYEFFGAALALAKPIWKATKEIISAPEEAIGFLSRSGRRAATAGHSLRWQASSGFPVIQLTPICRSETITTCLSHARKTPANWVHSQDAALLVKTINSLPHDLPIGTVHDCFVMHPADAEQVYCTARDELVEMYKGDPLGKWLDQISARVDYRFVKEESLHP